MKARKKIPHLKSEKGEIDFWSKNDSADYIDYSKAKKVSFPNLKPTTKMISLRLPEALIDRLKVMANKKDIPYQSLIKLLLSDKVEEELKR
ncbi:BrnA antitoxin family protein [Leptospira noguchii]|uniref:PF12441 family protein n=2 Tax=Leptospira noguchii TaxID=28182 RepID=T0GTU9_9LEPT|nr:BrnA antitoxin family protein [Leptospira noguchii]EMO55889.1 PF12441 family protein [Leptospira noguchii]EQA70791.1 PF12441 family protein [Leptospira noguchii serovar Panama str. CZ214]